MTMKNIKKEIQYYKNYRDKFLNNDFTEVSMDDFYKVFDILERCLLRGDEEYNSLNSVANICSYEEIKVDYLRMDEICFSDLDRIYLEPYTLRVFFVMKNNNSLRIRLSLLKSKTGFFIGHLMFLFLEMRIKEREELLEEMSTWIPIGSRFELLDLEE